MAISQYSDPKYVELPFHWESNQAKLIEWICIFKIKI